MSNYTYAIGHALIAVLVSGFSATFDDHHFPILFLIACAFYGRSLAFLYLGLKYG